MQTRHSSAATVAMSVPRAAKLAQLSRKIFGQVVHPPQVRYVVEKEAGWAAEMCAEGCDWLWAVYCGLRAARLRGREAMILAESHRTDAVILASRMTRRLSTCVIECVLTRFIFDHGYPPVPAVQR